MLEVITNFDWATLIAGLIGILVGAGIVARLTPTKKDDEIIAKAIGALKAIEKHVPEKGAEPPVNDNGDA